jgi:peptidoglycan/LPS O-acetylase OafA/YrhL
LEKNKENSIYLPGLNGLRAIAALSVVFAHISQDGIADFGLSLITELPMAGFGVTLFFVISGYSNPDIFIDLKRSSNSFFVDLV